jgi:hypothetical protein
MVVAFGTQMNADKRGSDVIAGSVCGKGSASVLPCPKHTILAYP